jgi:hypothetical protein
MPPWRSAAVAALAVVLTGTAAAVLVVVLGGSSSGLAQGHASITASAWRGLVGAPRPSVALGQRVIVLLNAPSLADRVRAAGGVASADAERRWTAGALASQQQFLADLANQGLIARPDLRFTRVVNGFSAVADSSAIALLERSPRVEGVYPVRAAFPAAVSIDTHGLASPLPSGLAPFQGDGVTVALLDTAVDPATPYLHGRVLAGLDVVSGGAAARWDQRPGGKRLETHGTTSAGILVGLGGPGRPRGLVPQATLLPIRVAGWQRDAVGRWSVHARSDQILAGLERAVDPNQDGDAHDAARVTLVPLVEPFAAFPDSPLSRAVEGASTLDSLVVTPAGNDGPSGPAFGSIAGPGGAPAALTVGAVDLRPREVVVPSLVRSELTVLTRRPLELLTATTPVDNTTLEIVSVPAGKSLDRHGVSRLAGRAALVEAGTSPRRAAERVAEAGAALVLLTGDRLPSGAIGLDPRLGVPVLAAPTSLLEEVRAQRAAGRTTWLSLGRATTIPSSSAGRPASFSSWGLSFGGEVKPDVVAPGVAVASSIPGADADGSSRLVTVSGASAAAAVAAGVAVRLAQARPGLDAAELRSALSGTARPVARGPAVAQGTGVVDGERASQAEVAVSPATVTFGRGSGDGWQGRRTLRVRNVSTRPLTVYLAAGPQRGGVSLVLSPRSVSVPAGGTAAIVLRARLTHVSTLPAVTGVVRVAPRGSQALAVPWSVVLSPPPADLVTDVELSEKRFTPSDLAPTVLAVRVGTIETNGGRPVLQPAQRFDVVLETAAKKPLGLLGRLRDVLPGRYAFGITGRGPSGRRLAPGRYVLRLVAWPAAGGRAVSRTVSFIIR